MYKDFEDYLMQRCQKENPDVLDDSFPDVFDDWLSNLEPDDWMKFADTYAQIKWGEGCEKGSQAVTQMMDMLNKAILG